LFRCSRPTWLLLAVGLWAPVAAAQPDNGSPLSQPDSASDLAAALRTPGALQSRLRFDHVTTADGLSNDSVFSILQDRHGFLWFGTQAGLNRYDGYRVTQYRYNPRDANSLGTDFVQILFEDSRGAIWTGHEFLCRFDPQTETFTRFPLPRGAGSLQAMSEDLYGRLWLATSGGSNAYRLDPRTGELVGVDIAGPRPAGQGNPAVSAFRDSAGMIWLGANTGLVRLDPSTGACTHYTGHGSAPSADIRAIAQDRAGNLWLAVPGGVLNFFDRVRGAYSYRWGGAKRQRSGAPATSILEGPDGVLWLGTSERLELFDPATGGLAFLRHDPADRYSIGANEVLSLAMDRDGNIWVGVKGAGASRFSPGTLRFGPWRPDPAEPQSLSDENVRAIYRDRGGAVWIGTYNGGLNRFDPVSGKFTHFRHDGRKPGSLDDDRIYSIYEDRAGDLWVGTALGINRLDRKTGTFSHFTHSALHPLERTVPTYSFLEDRHGVFWFGAGERRASLDRRTGTLSAMTQSGGLSMFEDRENNLWFASTYGGLTRVDPSGRARKIEPVSALSTSGFPQINYIQEDGQGLLWLAAETGLLRFNPKTEELTSYSTADGLPDNVVQCVLPDQAGNLWLSTNSGISRFNPRDAGFTNYHESDGLQGEQFNRKACFVDPSGMMYFGGLHGFNIFDPRRIPVPRDPSRIILTELRIHGTTVPARPGSILPKPVWQMDELNLSYKDNEFSVEFAALTYRDRARTRYRFRLEGLEDHWTEVDSRNRTARYTGLTPGNYRLRVQSSMDGRIWSRQEASLGISIAPPWWMTPWSRAALILATTTLLFAAYKLRTSALRQRELRLQTLVDRRTAELVEARNQAEQARNEAERANRAKSAFLANMSHELRTPLNAILGYSTLLREQSDSAQQRCDLDIIKRSGQHLLTLINEVLDFAKIEAGRVELDLAPCDVKVLVQDAADMMRVHAAEKDLALVLACSAEPPVYVRADAAKLREVLINLLGNAVKYTERGSVTLRFDVLPVQGGQQVLLRFEVEDTGIGIAPEDYGRIFEPFEQAARGWSQGTGLGLAITREFVNAMSGSIRLDSSPGRGSCFRVEIPVEQEAGPQAGSAPESERVPQLETGQPEFRILVVDDDLENRTLLERLLTKAGFPVRLAENGQQGVECFREWRPNFIWMDVRMPVMDGIQATQRIRALDGGKEVKIAAVTASGSDSQRSDVLAAGLDDYVTKPYRTAEIFACLARHLGIRYARAEEAPVIPGAQPATLSPHAIAALPAALRAELREAMYSLHPEQISRTIEKVAKHDAVLGALLARLAASLAYTRILTAIVEAEKPGLHAGPDRC
jgi:signal transduction histidine kinase/ligand-binding sensor domain-containing protein/CheY-like chemotaxis protein